MKKGLYIDYANSKQLNWWTNRGSKKCRYKHLDYMVKSNTGEAVGEFVELFGMFAKAMLKEGSKFHKDSKKIVIDIKK